MAINKNTIRCFGIRRSGNHGVLSWIFDGFDGVVVHLNNVRMTHVDPYAHFGRVILKGLPLRQYDKNTVRFLKHLTRKYVLGRGERVIIHHADRFLNLDFIRNFPVKDCFIYSYENCRFDDPILAQIDENQGTNIGTSRRSLDIVVLRDAPNLFASLLTSGMITELNCQSIQVLFKHYALGFVESLRDSSENLENNERVFVSYNRWLSDSQYRIDLANQIGFKSSGERYQFVPTHGGGSSFSGTLYSGKAEKMNTTKRWEKCMDKSFYRDLFSDRELCELSREVFGEIAPDLNC